MPFWHTGLEIFYFFLPYAIQVQQDTIASSTRNQAKCKQDHSEDVSAWVRQLYVLPHEGFATLVSPRACLLTVLSFAGVIHHNCDCTFRRPSLNVQCCTMFVSQTTTAILPEELSKWNENRVCLISWSYHSCATVPSTNLGFAVGLNFQVLHLLLKAAHSPFTLLSFFLLHPQTQYLCYSFPKFLLTFILPTSVLHCQLNPIISSLYLLEFANLRFLSLQT